MLLVTVLVIGIGLAHQDQNAAARIEGAGSPPLAPLDDIFIAVTAADRAGNESALAPGSVVGPVAAEDNRLPTPITAVVVENVPDDFGGALRVRWMPAFLPDFAEYRVYASAEPVEDVSGMTPASRVRNAFRTDIDITGLPSDAPVFVAVTVLDMTGNESALESDSVAGPAVAATEVTPDPSPLGLVGPTGGLRGTSAPFHWLRFATDRTEPVGRSEERRVGKECRSRWSPDH